MKCLQFYLFKFIPFHRARPTCLTQGFGYEKKAQKLSPSGKIMGVFFFRLQLVNSLKVVCRGDGVKG